MLHSRIGKPSTSEGTSGLWKRTCQIGLFGEASRGNSSNIQDVLLSNELDLTLNLYARQYVERPNGWGSWRTSGIVVMR